MYRRAEGTLAGGRPNRLMQRTDDPERFSSFESPPSDNDAEQFSDYETSREKAKASAAGPSPGIKEKSHILVEEMPVQYEPLLSSNKRQQSAKCLEKSVGQIKGSPHQSNTSKGDYQSNSSKGEGSRLKQNCPLRYNYMDKVERQLSTIPEDAKEDLRDSAFSSLHLPRSFPSKITAFDPLWRPTDYIYTDPNIALLEKQRLEMLMLEQENICLRERVLSLEKELRGRDEDRLRREAELIAERMLNGAQEDQLNSTRKEAKLKLVEEVAVLQARCREMKEEMRQYREKQEQTFTRLTSECEDAKLEVVRVKAANEYQAKFTEVFLNMVEKLPVDLEEDWSKKRKIAVGWKVVKHLVKKAFKLGIHPPAVAQRTH